MFNFNIKTRILVFVILFELIAYSTIVLFNNFSYSKELRKLKHQAITETIHASIGKVTSQSQLMERNAQDLGLSGEQLFAMYKQGLLSLQDLREQSKRILTQNFAAFAQGIGGGLWYEPYVLDPQIRYFGPFDKVLELIKHSIVKKKDDPHGVEIHHIEYDQHNEFTPIVAALDDVYRQVKSYMSEIVESNQQLMQSKAEVNALNRALEAKVTLRTEQLEAKTAEALTALELLKRTQQQFIEHEIEFECNCCDIEIYSIPGVLAQVVTNLVDNALLHGLTDISHGKISIYASIVEDRVKIVVADNGKGMAKEVRELIFEPFFTTARNTGGTGLGLHIVYNLVVQQLKGIIECESEEGSGSIFTIIFPLSQQETKTEDLPA